MAVTTPLSCSFTGVLLLISVLCLTQNVLSTIDLHLDFEICPAEVKQGLTKSITLNCSISDTVVFLPLLIIGKRDASPTDVTEQRYIRDTAKPVKKSREVLQTPYNRPTTTITSLKIYRNVNGKEVASVNTESAPQVMDGSANVQVSGFVGVGPGSAAYIQITITDPTINQFGEFVCKSYGSNWSFVEYVSVEPSFSDLVTFAKDLSDKNEDLQAANVVLSNKVSRIEEENANLKQMNLDLSQEFQDFKNKSEIMIYFNAHMQLGTSPHYSSGEVVVFDYVVENKGDDYNSKTGLFTCMISGYYHFTVGCVSTTGNKIHLDLLKNNAPVFRLYGASGGNAGTLQLARADVVKVVAISDTDISGLFCSFHGFLIQAL